MRWFKKKKINVNYPNTPQDKTPFDRFCRFIEEYYEANGHNADLLEIEMTPYMINKYILSSIDGLQNQYNYLLSLARGDIMSFKFKGAKLLYTEKQTPPYMFLELKASVKEYNPSKDN